MRIFSAIRPTGDIHLGNYLGAIKQWIDLQQKNECVFCIVDLHAITTPYNEKTLQQDIMDVAGVYLATGVDVTKSIIFVQSDVKEHAELAWLLGTIAPMGELSRMTQYKEKSKTHKDYVNLGLFSYPVLMAADILLYGSKGVPVGKDQEQHVELARTLARKFNQKFGNVFDEPQAILPKVGAKIMSLTDPKKKMSKTDEPRSYISLFDSKEDIQKKIMAATTDSGKDILYNVTKKPGISNLLVIYSLIEGTSTKKVEKDFQGKTYSEFKKSLATLLVSKLEPFRRKQREIETRDMYVREILKTGADKAKVLAEAKMREVKKAMGLVS